jgi:hypothetical protein
MMWSQLRDLDGEDIVIGSNAHTYRPLDVMSKWEAGEELALSRSLLEHQLERIISLAAYPSGLASQTTQAAAERVGFRGGCTLRGAVSSNYENRFALSRIPVDGTMRPEILIAHLTIASRRLPRDREPVRVKMNRAARRVGTIGSTEASIRRSEASRGRRLDNPAE